MNLNLEDSLSDKSVENDVFFEELLSTRRKTRKQLNASSKRKENLSGIEEESDFEFEMSLNKPSATSTPRISNEDDGTDDEDLGFDPKKPKATSNKLDFFDDILGGTLSDNKRPATASIITPQPAARRREERRPTISRQSTDTTTDNSVAQRPKTSTGRRGSGLSTINNPDPLGIFNQPAKEIKKRGSTADWLGLNVSTEPEEAKSHIETRAESPKAPNAKNLNQQPTTGYDILKLNETLEPQDVAETTLTANELIGGVDVAAQSMLQLNNMNLETRGAFTMLQQQESQLNTAAQMKQQERALLDMQRKQEILLHQQERQFQALMQQQMQRQQHLEENIKLQQQRINAHIQLMLTQPATALEMGGPIKNEEPKKIGSTDVGSEVLTTHNEPNVTSQAALDMIQIETDLRRLELEKLRLEELVVNTKANYEREIEIIETTFKKQIKLLNEHAESLEARFRAEITEITDFYKTKLKVLEEEQRKSKSHLENDITTLKQDHEDELRRLRKSHEEDLDMLRDEQRRMLENLQRSKMWEFAAMQDNNSYLATLKAASANLTEATTDLQTLREQLQTKLETANQEKQQTLEARERQLDNKERRLQLSEANTEQEKMRLMKLVSSLEQQLSTLTKEMTEENWQLRLKLSALEADKAAFEREREYAREQMLRDEQRLATLKDEQIAEAKRLTLELQEERHKLQMDKTKFETQQKLRTNNTSIDKERCDLEVAMKCAQEAAQQADVERQRYFSLQCELEQLKRKLVDKETMLRVQQEKMNVKLKACAVAEQQAKDAAQRARLTEQNFQEKLQTLQQRTRELAEKEAFLAEERQLLSQQRIAIKEVQSRVAQRKCAACQKLNINGCNDSSKEKSAETQTQKTTVGRSPMFIVDRLLDENIAESLQRLQQSSTVQQQTNTMASTYHADALNYHQLPQTGYVMTRNLDYWLMPQPLGLDDDSKTLALSNLDTFQFEHDSPEDAAAESNKPD